DPTSSFDNLVRRDPYIDHLHEMPSDRITNSISFQTRPNRITRRPLLIDAAFHPKREFDLLSLRNRQSRSPTNPIRFVPCHSFLVIRSTTERRPKRVRTLDTLRPHFDPPMVPARRRSRHRRCNFTNPLPHIRTPRQNRLQLLSNFRHSLPRPLHRLRIASR